MWTILRQPGEKELCFPTEDQRLETQREAQKRTEENIHYFLSPSKTALGSYHIVTSMLQRKKPWPRKADGSC
jgi:hypothetical protein